MSRRFSALLLLLFPVLIVQAQDPKPADVKPAPNKIVAVTVYQNTALVTREVTAPDAAGTDAAAPAGAAGIVFPASDATFESVLELSSRVPVVVEFYALGDHA